MLPSYMHARLILWLNINLQAQRFDLITHRLPFQERKDRLRNLRKGKSVLVKITSAWLCYIHAKAVRLVDISIEGEEILVLRKQELVGGIYRLR